MNAQYQNRTDDIITLGDIFNIFREARKPILILISIFILTSVLLITYRLIQSYEHRYEQIISFTFSGVEERKYVNGNPFRLNDLLAPSVLRDVHANLKLDEHQISLHELSQAINIKPYSVSRDFIIEKYKSVLEDKEATTIEKQEAQSALEKDLSRASSYSALMTISLSKSLPETLVIQILEEIPKVWAEQTILIKGAMSVNFNTLSEEIIHNSLYSTDSLIDNFQKIWRIFTTLKSHVVNTAQNETINTVQDTQNHFRIIDLQQNLNNIEARLITSPQTWSSDSRKSQKLNVGLYSPNLFNPSIIEDLDYIISLDVVSQRINLTKVNTSRLLQHPAAFLCVDQVSGLGLIDIQELLDDLLNYELHNLRAPLLQLGISRDSKRVVLYYQFKIKELIREKQELEEKAIALNEAEVRYLDGSLNTASQAETSTTPQSEQSAILAPQLGDAFIDKLISLSQKGDDVSFRQELNKKTTDLKQNAIEINTQLSRLKEYLDIFSSAKNNNDREYEELKRIYEKEVEELILKSLEKARYYAEVTQRIAEQLQFVDTVYNTVKESAYAPSGSGFYLEERQGIPALSLEVIASEMAEVGASLQKILDKRSKDFVGFKNDLFSYASVPKKNNPALVDRNDVILLTLICIISIVLIIFWQLFKKALSSRDRTRSMN